MQDDQSPAFLLPKVGVGAWVVDNGKVLMGRRLTSHGKDKWACPGGHLEFGEDPIDGAKRELEEETGLLAEEIHFACWTNDVIDEAKKHYLSLHMVITKFVGEVILKEPDKCFEWQWLSIDEIPKGLFLPAKNFIQKGILQIYLEASKKEAIS